MNHDDVPEEATAAVAAFLALVATCIVARDRQDGRMVGQDFRQRVEGLLPEVLSAPELSPVQGQRLAKLVETLLRQVDSFA